MANTQEPRVPRYQALRMVARPARCARPYVRRPDGNDEGTAGES